jgi:hypothetical protein
LGAIKEKDKRKAARHEAGHIVYAQAMGVRIWGWLYQNPDPPMNFQEAFEKRYWLGRSAFSGDKFWSLNVTQRAAFGVAGCIAEEEEFDVDFVMDTWEDLGFSETDLSYISADWDIRFVAVREAIAVLTNGMAWADVTEILYRNEVYPITLNTHLLCV